MVRGLDRFREYFSAFADRYVLIGGTACDLSLTDAGLAFRATRDLDIVLCIESLDREFGRSFWSFVQDAGYGQQETSTGAKKFYRFQKPSNETYPEMIELFSRVPDAIIVSDESHLTPIPIDEEISSLSAILLNDDYYRWIQDGKIELQGVPLVGADHLIPLKARAWVELRERKRAGDRIDSRDIKKHKNDVFRLLQIVDPGKRHVLPDAIGTDMRRFVNEVQQEPPDLKSLGIKTFSLKSSMDIVNAVYGLE